MFPGPDEAELCDAAYHCAFATVTNATEIAMQANIVIRAPRRDERPDWEPLWKGYLDFYKTAVPKETYDATWARLHDPDEPMALLGAYVEGKLRGIVHYIYHRSCWTVGDYCYLQDLCVAEDARKLGIGRALIEAVYNEAHAAGASRVYWLTHESNATARALYDKLADCPGFIVYRHLFADRG
jgi:ribosomal protein S18 acetylase RimI-like enzyme